MGRINLQRVVLGGLLAGLVLNVVDFLLYGVILAPDLAAAMQAMGKPPVAGSAIGVFVVLDFLYGIALVWGYAAIRPRFGAGPRTAVYAGMYVWMLIALLHAIGESPMGFMPQNVVVIGTLVALVVFPLAAVAGAKVYTEA